MIEVVKKDFYINDAFKVLATALMEKKTFMDAQTNIYLSLVGALAPYITGAHSLETEYLYFNSKVFLSTLRQIIKLFKTITSPSFQPIFTWHVFKPTYFAPLKCNTCKFCQLTGDDPHEVKQHPVTHDYCKDTNTCQ